MEAISPQKTESVPPCQCFCSLHKPINTTTAAAFIAS